MTSMEAEPIQAAQAPARGVMRRHHKLLGVALVLCVVLAASLYPWSGPPHASIVAAPAPPPSPPPPPIEIKTVQAQRADIEQTVLASGKLQLFRYEDLGAPISGVIDGVFATVGDEVKAGKRLLKITPNVSVARLEGNQAQLAQLRAELTEQQAQLEFAELQFRRQTQLKSESATSEESFESSRAVMASAAARAQAIKAHIQQTESATKDDDEARQHTEVMAPFAGTVVGMSARVGQAVTAHQQGPALVRVADLSKLTVQARVAEIDVPHVHKGTPASFTTPAYPGKRWYGRVRQIMPVPADGSGEPGKDTFYDVLFEVGNPGQQLLSGMSTQVSFVVARAHAATTVPVGVLGKPDGDGLYSVEILDADGRPQLRPIRIGIRNQTQAQALSGLEPGERIVVGTSSVPGPSASVASGRQVASPSVARPSSH